MPQAPYAPPVRWPHGSNSSRVGFSQIPYCVLRLLQELWICQWFHSSKCLQRCARVAWLVLPLSWGLLHKMFFAAGLFQDPPQQVLGSHSMYPNAALPPAEPLLRQLTPAVLEKLPPELQNTKILRQINPKQTNVIICYNLPAGDITAVKVSALYIHTHVSCALSWNCCGVEVPTFVHRA